MVSGGSLNNLKADFHETNFAAKPLVKLLRHTPFLFVMARRIRKKVGNNSTRNPH